MRWIDAVFQFRCFIFISFRFSFCFCGRFRFQINNILRYFDISLLPCPLHKNSSLIFELLIVARECGCSRKREMKNKCEKIEPSIRNNIKIYIPFWIALLWIWSKWNTMAKGQEIKTRNTNRILQTRISFYRMCVRACVWMSLFRDENR